MSRRLAPSPLAAQQEPAEPMLLVWESSSLHHPAKIDRLDVLLDLANQGGQRPCRSVTTAAVREELNGYGLDLPSAVEVVHVDGLDELSALARWVGLLSSDQHNRGEATVCAWAEVLAARSSWTMAAPDAWPR